MVGALSRLKAWKAWLPQTGLKTGLEQERRRKKPGAAPGYSLLEILIVVAIVGLLVTLVAPQLFGRLDDSRFTAAEAQIRMLRSALDSYRLDVGEYPDEAQGLSALVTAPAGGDANWRGPYLDGGEVPLDPWGNPYHFNPTGSGDAPAIYSLGADGRPGGTGNARDVGNLPAGSV